MHEVYPIRGQVDSRHTGRFETVNHADGDGADASMLTGVSETALLTLNGRAHQARHRDAIIDDPMAIRLVDAIEFDFDKFGRKGQEMALRSLAFDRAATRYLSRHRRRPRRRPADELLAPEQFAPEPPRIPLGHRRFPADRRPASAAAACFATDHQPCAVGTRLHVDGRGGHEQRRLHHRGGPADVSAARRGDGSHHRVRQTVSSIAKAYVSEAVNRVAGQALQLPGGIGFTWEHDLHLLPTAGPRQRPALR